MEGSAVSQLLKIIKDTGYNKDSFFHIGTITGTSINLGDITIERADYILCEKASNLITGNKVLVIQDGTSFFVIDKVVG